MSKASLHKKISDWVRDQIKKGNLQVDDKIPSEHELAHQFEVSRLTVRRALQTLEQEHIIFRAQGIGAFVKAPIPKKNLIPFCSFNEDLSKAGIRSESLVLSKDLEIPDFFVRKILGIDENKKVFKIIRLRLGNSRAFAYDVTWLPVFYGQLIHDQNLQFTSIYKLLEQEYLIPILKGCQRFDAALATEEIAKQLQVEVNSPLLLIRKASYTTANKIVYYQERYLRTDRFAYEMQLERNQNQETENEVSIKEFSPVFDQRYESLPID